MNYKVRFGTKTLGYIICDVEYSELLEISMILDGNQGFKFVPIPNSNPARFINLDEIIEYEFEKIVPDEEE